MLRKKDSSDIFQKLTSLKKLERTGKALCISVSEEENDFREANFRDMKKVLKEEILCTTCGKNLEPNVVAGQRLFYHPHLEVLMCENCKLDYKDGNFSPDEDGTDKYCRWCAQGGTLYCCSKCVCSFCKKCVKKNLGREMLKTIKEADWECFICQPEPLFKCRAVCYAALKYSHNRRRLINESKKIKLNELADKKRRGIKPERLGPKRKRESTSLDREQCIGIEASDFNSTSTAQQCLVDEDGFSHKNSSKGKSGPKHKLNRSLKAIKKSLVRESSEDFTDSDFEPKNSQRLKPCIQKKSHHLKESTVKTVKIRKMDQVDPTDTKIKKQDDATSSGQSTPQSLWVLLDSHAEDVACVSTVLSDQIGSFKKRYLQQSWKQHMLHMATKDLQRYIKRAVQALSDVDESLSCLINSPLNGSLPLKTVSVHSETEEEAVEQEVSKKRKTEIIDNLDGDNTKKKSHLSASSENILEENCTSPNPKQKDTPSLRAHSTTRSCGSIESDNEDAASPMEQRCGSIDSEGGEDIGSPKMEEDPCNSGTPESPMESDEMANAIVHDFDMNPDGSIDLFADEDLDNQSNHSKSVVSASESELSNHSNPESSSPVGQVTQSANSLACKANLMNSSSSESDNEEHVVKRKVNESDSNSDPDCKTRSATSNSNRKKSSFNIEDLPVYKLDTKLHGKCTVNLNRLEEKEEKRLTELIGDYYDSSSSADSDSDHSINKLTNLHSLKHTARGSDDSSEKSSKSANGQSRKTKKTRKSKSKKEEKLADFLNKSNVEGSEVESSPQKEQMVGLSEMDQETTTLNEMQKKILLQSSDSENDQSDTETKECLKDEVKIEPKEEEQRPPSEVETDNVDAEIKCKTEKKSDSDSDSAKKKDWRKDKLLSGKLSDTDTSDDDRKLLKKKAQVKDESDSSDSDQIHVVKRKSQESSRKKADSDVDSSTSEDFVTSKKRKAPAKQSSSSSSSESEKAKTKKKRRRIKMPNSDSSEDEGKEKDTESPNKGRKKIRHVIAENDLEEGTKEAAKEEEERLKRIAARQKMYDEVYETVQKGFDVLETLVLDFDEKTKEPLVEVDKALVKKLKPHQAKGIKFMWDACFESLKRIKSSKGSGCILAHCMGLGKTFQVVTLVHTLFKFPETKVNTVLVVCPVSTVLNWVNEFHKWLKDLKDGPDIETFEMTRCKQNQERSYRLRDWKESGGVMVIGYDMYRNLTNPESKRVRASIMKTFQTALVNPGPDLVICDEGHLLKNEDTGISKAMTRVRTLRRVILTGTPLQNNLKEYHCMVQFVKPNLLGTRKEFLNRFVNPITNGQFEDSTSHDVKRMKRRAHVLHKTLEGCVQRFDYSVLTPFLPSKEEYVISVRLTELQEKLYRHYLEQFSSKGYQGKGAQLFADFQQLQRIWTHPRVLKMSQERNELKAEKEDEEDSEGSLKDFIDDDDESDSNESSSSPSSSDDDVVCLSDGSHTDKKTSKEAPKPGRRTRSNKDVPSDPEPPEPSKNAEWWESYLESNELEDLRESSKLVLLFSILKDCEENGEKLLVFSQSLFSLNVIEYFLGKIDESTQKGVQEESLNGHQGSWSLGIDYFRLDGSTPTETRSIWCNLFNKTSNLKGRLFLISTKAGGLGINLVAANRVIIFDASWNPSHDVQSIFRVYRFGQKKPCFIYRFLAQGTMEEKIYERQVTKLSLACRVVDELQIERYYKMADLQELYNFTPADRNIHELPKLPKDHLFAEILKSHGALITTYHEHDSLLENKEEEELNEEERKAAWEDYEVEKKGPVQGAQFGLAEHLPTMEQLITLIQQRHPEKTPQEVTESAAHAYRQMMQQQQQQQQQMLQKNMLQQYYQQQQQLKQQQLRMQQYTQFGLQQQTQFGLQQPHQTYQQQQYNNLLVNSRMPQPMAYQFPRNLNSQGTFSPSASMPSHSRQGILPQPTPQLQPWQVLPAPFSQAHKEP